MAKSLYDIELNFSVTQQAAKHVKVTHTYSTKVDGFEVIGGTDRFIMTDGRGAVGDADVMSEFYQAKQFQKLNIVKQLNRESFVVDKVYYLKLAFEFNLLIKSLSPTSRFRSMRLHAKNARLINPPDRDSNSERLQFKFSDPEIYHIYYDFSEREPVKVMEML